MQALRAGARVAFGRMSVRVAAAAVAILAVVIYLSDFASQGALPATLAAALTLERVPTWLLGILLLAPAVIQATSADLELASDRYLDGLPPRREAVVDAVVALFVTVVMLALSLVLVAITAAVDGSLRMPAPASVARPGPAGIVASAAAVSLLVTLLGAALGRCCRTRPVAVVAALGAGALAIVLERLGGYLPVLDHLNEVAPSGAVSALASAPLQPPTGGELAAGVGWTIVAGLVLLGAARLPQDQRRRERGRGRTLGVAVGGLAAASVAVGAVVPVALREQVPWWLRPEWLADDLADRASDDIVRAQMVALREGHTNALTRWRGALVAPAAIRSVRNVTADGTAPGTVIVDMRLDDEERQLWVCTRRGPSGWMVVEAHVERPCA